MTEPRPYPEPNQEPEHRALRMRTAAALIAAAIFTAAAAERTPNVTIDRNSVRACLEFGLALDTSADADPAGYLFIDTRNCCPGNTSSCHPTQCAGLAGRIATSRLK